MIVKTHEDSKIAIIDSNLMTFKTLYQMDYSCFDAKFVVLQSEIVNENRIMIEYMIRDNYEKYLKSSTFDEN